MTSRHSVTQSLSHSRDQSRDQVTLQVTRDQSTCYKSRYSRLSRIQNTPAAVLQSNPDFDGQFDLCPYIDLDKHGERRWNNVMLGNIAWRRSVSP